MNIDAALSPALHERREAQLYRTRPTLNSAQSTQVELADGRVYLAFNSNDYLGLANHPKLKEAAIQATSRWGTGSGASHLVCGHSYEHHALEEELAAFTGRERALLFSSGYMANMGTINALIGSKDGVFEDKLNHASLLDAGLLSGARFQRFLHNDPVSLENKLASSAAERKLVVVDGVFSMDGDTAPLHSLPALCDRYDAWLMADDAHGFGVLGERGAGVIDAFDLDQNQLPIYMATLGKALGSSGAFIAGSEVLIETLIQFARNYIYTTALPPAVAAASRAALKLVQTEPERRQQLQKNIGQFRAGAEAINLQLMASQTGIQPVVLGSEAQTLAVFEALKKRGFLVGAIRPPTVAVGSSRLRITLSAEHTTEQIDRLLSALDDVLGELAEKEL